LLTNYLNTTEMTFTIDTYNRLKKEYNNARQNNLEIFTFDGHELLTDYAKYMIEYLKTKFEK
jgi:hypothetical protein